MHLLHLLQGLSEQSDAMHCAGGHWPAMGKGAIRGFERRQCDGKNGLLIAGKSNKAVLTSRCVQLHLLRDLNWGSGVSGAS
jgi:hypothetical protein